MSLLQLLEINIQLLGLIIIIAASLGVTQIVLLIKNNPKDK
ncbi:hypothetical protein [Virgibacillus litoralis]|nr:hypothetical protein [Virgibacillus litoralis]